MPQEDKNFCTIYLVRHGETEMNKNGVLQGHLDSPLTELGVEQVNATAQELKDVSFDAIFSSDLERAVRTAEIVRLERQIAIQTSKMLRERSYGSYEGKSSEQYRKNFRETFEKIKTLSNKDRMDFKLASDIESDGEVVGRFVTRLREIGVAYAGKTVLVVSHGACMRTFLTHLGYAKYEELLIGAISNGAFVKVLCDGVDFFIKEVKGVKRPNSG